MFLVAFLVPTKSLFKLWAWAHLSECFMWLPSCLWDRKSPQVLLVSICLTLPCSQRPFLVFCRFPRKGCPSSHLGWCAGLGQEGRMGCPSQTELGPDPGSTVRAVRPRASHCPSPRAFLIWETGVLILLFSPSWPLLLVMCRKEMVFFTLPLCRVGVNSSGSTANSPHA